MAQNTTKTVALCHKGNEDPSCSNCEHHTGELLDIEDMGVSSHTQTRHGQDRKQSTTAKRRTAARVIAALAKRPENHGLPGEFFSDAAIYEADIEHIFHKEWIFAGHTIEIREPGEWLTVQVGDYPVLIMRGNDGKVRAFHNVCRHRGYKLTAGTHGQLSGKTLVCPYHKWAYDIDGGDLIYAREMPSDFDAASHGLMPVHLQCVSSYMFVCVAATPPDFSDQRQLLATYGKPYELESGKVAHQSRIIEMATGSSSGRTTASVTTVKQTIRS